MKKYVFILLGISFIGLSAQSQTKWTLRQCIDYAIEHNIEVKQQAISVEKAKNDLSTSNNSRLPNLNASLGQNFNFRRSKVSGTSIDNDPTTSYISNRNNSSRTSFDVSTSVPLFTGFKIPNEKKMNELNLKAESEGLERIKQNKELQVTSYYLEVLFKKEILKAYQEQAGLSKTQVEKTEILVNSGKVPLSQLYDIKAQLAKDELNVTTSENALNLALLDLAQALNIEESTGFDISDPQIGDVITENQSSIRPPSEIYSVAIAVKPHVKEAEYHVQSSRKALKVAQSGYYPTLDLSLGYGTSSERIYGVRNVSFTNQVRDNGSEYINFSLSIPIFNRFQTRNSVRAARLQIYNNELSLDNVKLALYKEIQQAYQSATAAQAKYTSTEKSLQAAQEAYKYAEERYSVGKSTVFELGESQTKLLTSKSEQIQAKYDFLFRAKILDFYMGKEINID